MIFYTDISVLWSFKNEFAMSATESETCYSTDKNKQHLSYEVLRLLYMWIINFTGLMPLRNLKSWSDEEIKRLEHVSFHTPQLAWTNKLAYKYSDA